ncbi:MAG: YihY/virulence factor BrkB family protein [Ligilactobacillus animalis]|uniref:YihY/virulence factor BrkB family protein n=1 Tax=Ligilactobacillus animalis TaxID=1605 RepID=UPI002903ABAF|nr:YihY/virulence factor BrkB family protein [Ligilactobacillus animalis]MDU3187557.1 YihY/virulence factor BrkB family protein [Ligilactobacillus animalis]
MEFKTVKQELDAFYKIASKNFKRANISNTAIVIAYYTLVAIFPMVIFIGNILPLLHIKAGEILPYLEMAVPKAVYTTLEPLLETFLSNGSSGGVASVSGVISVWAASRGINTLKKAFNEAFGVGNDQGIFTQRILSFLITIFIGALLVIAFIVYSFGQLVLEYLIPIFGLPLDWLTTFTQLKWPTTLLGIFLIMCLLYLLVPNAKVHLRYLWVGALFSTLGWMLLTQGFSIYVRYFARSVLSYGTIGTFIVLLFWMNYSALVIMVGAVINATLEERKYGTIRSKRTLDHFNDSSVKRFFNWKRGSK